MKNPMFLALVLLPFANLASFSSEIARGGGGGGGHSENRSQSHGQEQRPGGQHNQDHGNRDNFQHHENFDNRNNFHGNDNHRNFNDNRGNFNNLNPNEGDINIIQQPGYNPDNINTDQQLENLYIERQTLENQN